MNRKQPRAKAQPGKHGPAAPMRAWFRAALAHQRARRSADAERVCREILSVDPGDPETLHLLALVEHQRGRSDDAIDHIRMAIARNGRNPALHHSDAAEIASCAT